MGSYHYAEQWHAEAVQSMDPNQFILLLQQYPFHCPTLLQLAQVYRAQVPYSPPTLLESEAVGEGFC